MGKRPSEHRSVFVRWQRRLRNVRRRIYGWAAALLSFALQRIPYRLARRLSLTAADPLLRLMLWRRADEHLRLAYPEMPRTERAGLLRTMFRGTALLLAEWIGFAREGPAFIERRTDDEEGRRKINDMERESGKGWVGVTAHIGNWELLAQWMAHISLCPMGGIIAKRQPNPHLNRVIEKWRGRYGMATLYSDDPPRKAMRLLKGGHAIGVAGDQDVASLSGVFIDFLGRPAYTPVGPARLAYTADVPMIVGVMVREGDRFRVKMSDPIYPDRSRPREQEVLRLTKVWSAILERWVRETPEQWPWFHRRWKTTPERLLARQRRELGLVDSRSDGEDTR